MKLDTLYLELKATTDELQKNLRSADSRISTTERGLNKLASMADRASARFSHLGKAIANVKNALLTSALVGAGVSLVATTSKATAEIYELSKIFDIPIEKLNILDKELQHFGGSAKDVITDLTNLQKNYKATTGVEITGIALIEKLPKLAKDLEKLNPLEAFQNLKDAGFSDAFAKFLLTGEQAVSKYLKDAKLFATYTEDEAEAIYKANKQLEDFFITIKDLSNRLLVAFSPQIKGIAESFEKFSKQIKENPQYIKDLAKEFAYWSKWILGAIAVLWTLDKVFNILTGTITTVQTAFKVFRFFMANPYVAAILLVVAALGVLIYKWDDWAPKIKEWAEASKIAVEEFTDFFVRQMDKILDATKVLKLPGLGDYNLFDAFKTIPKIVNSIGYINSTPYTYPQTAAAAGNTTYIGISGVDINSNATSVQQLTKDILRYNGQRSDSGIRQAMSNFDDGVAN